MTPSPPKDQVNQLIALFNRGELTAVIEQGEALARSHPDAGILCEILGAANLGLQRLDAAILQFERATRIDPGNAESWNNLGALQQHAGHPAKAVGCFEKAIELRPAYAEAHFNLGGVLRQLGRQEEAIACFGKLVALQPGNAELHNDLGAALRDVGRTEAAIASLRRALAIQPGYADALYNLGAALRDAGRPDMAADALARSAQLAPNVAETQCALGGALRDLGRYDEAAACYARAVEIDPAYAEAQAQKAFVLATICDWRTGALDPAALPELERRGSSVSPFVMLALDDAPARHRARAERFAAERYGSTPPAPPAPPGARPERLRIGYFSADFHGHATMRLMARLFEVHDRARFSLQAFSFGPDSDDPLRARLIKSVDGFHDVRGLGDRDIAALAREAGVDIAVDLKGYTTDARPGIFAHRAAPIQVSYLGYPATMGAAFIDYIIADETVVPRGGEAHYSEQVIRLPDSYQVNDNTRAISNRPVSRADMGLPEQGLVFCCFNNNYKISPDAFDIWMRLLRRVDGAVLWLYRDNDWAMANLRMEAAARGVDPDRLVFAGRAPAAEHLARHRLADLFLDTFTCNAHTTASDALWAGLPVLTKAGEGFAARVAASLLNAVGLPELITTSAEAYEARAMELAADRARLDDLKRRLAAARDTAPLFDTERFARQIESAYDQVHARYRAGEAPGPIPGL